MYGREPPPLLSYTPGAARTTTVDALLQDRDSFLNDVKQRLLQAQEYAKKHYDANHRQLEFSVGTWVHRPHQSLIPGRLGKLGPRYAGPFTHWRGGLPPAVVRRSQNP